MIRARLRRMQGARGDDSGFTLPELVVSIVILSFIMGAIGLTMVVVLKSTRSSTDRITAGGSAQTLSLWFPGDVQSARARGASTAALPTGCGDDQGSTNVILLQRSDLIDAPGDTVSYRLWQTGSGDYELWRVACTGGQWTRRIVVQGIVDPATVQVTAKLRGAEVTLPLTIDKQFDELSLAAAIGTGDAVELRVSGAPRTPGQAVPCQVTSGAPQTVQRVDGGRLTTPPVFAVSTVGDCLDLTLTVEPNDLGSALTLAPGPNNWQATAPDVTWRIGPHQLVVLDRGTEVGRFPLEVLPEPCSVKGLEPNDRLRIGADGFPASPTGSNYVLTTTTSCDVDRLVVDMGDANPLTIRPTGGNGRFPFTIGRDDGPWTAETHLLRVFSGADELESVNLVALFSDCVAGPGSRVFLVTSSPPYTLRHSDTELVVSTGRALCPNPVLATTSNGITDLGLAPAAPGLWSGGAIAGFAADWTPRVPVTVSVTSGGDDAGSFQVPVDDCELVQPAPNRIVEVPIKEGQVDNETQVRFVTDFQCSAPTLTVRFVDANLTPHNYTATRAGGGAGPLQRTWTFTIEKDIPLGTGQLDIEVFDDASRTAPSPWTSLGTFPVLGVPE